MATTKDAFTQMLNKQQELMDTFQKNAHNSWELFQVDNKMSEKGTELAKEYFDKSRTLAEEMMKPENMEKFMEKAPHYFTKAMEINTDFFSKTMDFYRDAWKGFGPAAAQHTMQKMVEISRDNFNAMLETANQQVKLVQETMA
jgi:hypothetical protein